MEKNWIQLGTNFRIWNVLSIIFSLSTFLSFWNVCGRTNGTQVRWIMWSLWLYDYYRQSWVPELNGPQLGTRFLPLLSKCVTNSPVHLLIKCCWQAQWCPAYQEQLGVQGLAQEHFNTGGSNRDPRDSWTPSVPPAETACLQNNKGSFLEASGRRFSGCAHPPLVGFLLTAWLFSLLGCWNCVFMSL